MKLMLVRVGIDSTYGKWNAPVNPKTQEFAYVPIPEEHPNKGIRPGYERWYKEFKIPCEQFGEDFPKRLLDQPAHVDPDFQYLTYGDEKQKGKQIRILAEGDIVAFYAGLKLIQPHPRQLLYALIGLYVVDKVIAACDFLKEDWHKNAHTRRFFDSTDWIVIGKPCYSGRLERCIPIGEWRNSAYRIRPDLLETWGSLSASDGYIQRSAVLPCITDASRFYAWFEKQNIPLVAANNL